MHKHKNLPIPDLTLKNRGSEMIGKKSKNRPIIIGSPIRSRSSSCPRLTTLVRGLWNGLRTCVCASGLKINEKCYFSVISWSILILFVLSDRAWCGLQNLYTEFWNSLIMQIYANLFKINEKCYFSVISWPILILFVLSDRAWCGLQNLYTEFWNSLIMQIYANLF